MCQKVIKSDWLSNQKVVFRQVLWGSFIYLVRFYFFMNDLYVEIQSKFI